MQKLLHIVCKISANFQWDLVCDKSYLIETTNFLGILGGMTVGGGLSILADYYGRKWIFLVAMIGAIVAGVLNGLCRTLLAYTITRVVLTTFQTVKVFSLFKRVIGHNAIAKSTNECPKISFDCGF